MARTNISEKVRSAVFDAADWKCQRCGCDLTVSVESPRHALFTPNYATVDHIVPLAKGGTDARSNLQALCARCNKSKKDRT